MDEIVRQAMHKWPNVPHCYGWLRLDARGAWRMRDEHAQQFDLPGEPIHHPALLAFILRNYGHDAQGRWYFQNGPQRVYVDLALMPYLARTRPSAQGLTLALHTGEVLETVDAAWMDGTGRLYLRQADRAAAVDDRDLAELLPDLRQADGRVDEQALLRWLEGDDASAPHWHYRDTRIGLQRLDAGALETTFGFIARPRAD